MTNARKRDLIRELLFNELKIESDARQKRISNLIPQFKDMYHLEHEQPSHCYDIFEHTLRVVDGMASHDELGRLAALFHDIGKPYKRYRGADGVCHYQGHAELSSVIANQVLTNLGYPTDIVNAVTFMCLYHDSFLDKSYDEFIAIAKTIGFGNVGILLELQKSDLYAHAEHYRKKHLSHLLESHERVEYFMKRAVEEGLYNPGD